MISVCSGTGAAGGRVTRSRNSGIRADHASSRPSARWWATQFARCPAMNPSQSSGPSTSSSGAEVACRTASVSPRTEASRRRSSGSMSGQAAARLTPVNRSIRT
ncbi:hypothetical protein IMZ11_03080 [Microtetraspora sp. AC03309]|nr:hypothetical protein [Microtetraspora sp. AC03309]MCC5574620.1 hypothetical protein [Microtetraspora sp. AC03309]